MDSAISVPHPLGHPRKASGPTRKSVVILPVLLASVAAALYFGRGMLGEELLNEGVNREQIEAYLGDELTEGLATALSRGEQGQEAEAASTGEPASDGAMPSEGGSEGDPELAVFVEGTVDEDDREDAFGEDGTLSSPNLDGDDGAGLERFAEDGDYPLEAAEVATVATIDEYGDGDSQTHADADADPHESGEDANGGLVADDRDHGASTQAAGEERADGVVAAAPAGRKTARNARGGAPRAGANRGKQARRGTRAAAGRGAGAGKGKRRKVAKGRAVKRRRVAKGRAHGNPRAAHRGKPARMARHARRTNKGRHARRGHRARNAGPANRARMASSTAATEPEWNGSAGSIDGLANAASGPSATAPGWANPDAPERGPRWAHLQTAGGSGGVKEPALGQGGSGSGWQCSGNVPKKQVRQVVDRSEGAIRACYERELRTDKTLQGRVRVKLLVNAVGGVTAARIQGSMPNQRVRGCVTRHAEQWLFPAPTGGTCAVVVTPYRFKPEPPDKKSKGKGKGKKR